jgi:drug/metabolite transporter (DMT)-like permease
VIADPKLWRGVSSALLVVLIAALLIGPGLPQWGWIAALGSGVAFAIELVLGARARRRDAVEARSSQG